jgi:dipeptidyl aminopeptidase/acylaminoacyl peptidase
MTKTWIGLIVALGGSAVTAAPPRAAAPPAQVAPAGGLRAAAPADPVPLEALAELPFIADPELSPDGKKIVAKVNNSGREALAVYDLAAGTTQTPVFIDHPGSVHWVQWAGNDRVLVGCTLFSVIIGSTPLAMTRLVSFDLKTKKSVTVDVGHGFIGDAVIFTDPDGRYILAMSQRDAFSTPSVQRIDLATGEATEVQKHKEGVWSWFTDGAGAVRGGLGYEDNGWRVYARDPATGNVRRIASGRIDPKRESTIEGVRVIPGSDTGIIITNERTGRFGIYRFALAENAIGEPIFEHPVADVKKAEFGDDKVTLDAVYYEDDKPRVVWFNTELKQIQAQIDRTFPGKVNRILNYSRDRQTVLVWTGSADDPGSYYIFDRKARRMNAFAAPYEQLVDRKLGTTTPVTYQARDGLAIPGYLTLPPGRTAKDLPLILMPHGGPFARTSYEFDPIVQMLATRGYAVLQPNFRGSTGYGRDFVEKGYGQWGEAMQDDLDDGVEWLARQGTIDLKRVCIVGGSYGGYAALWGAIRNPERYRCAVSLAGVTDVRGMLKYDARRFYETRYSKQWRKKVEGQEKKDLAAVSPLQQQARLHVPVLVAHGEDDATVPVTQSRQLVAALKARGASVQAAYYPGEGHGFSASADLLDYMRRLSAFLEVHNPPDGALPPKGPREPQLAGGKIDPAALKALAGKKKPTGSLALSLAIAPDGRVTGCTLEAASGVGAIDKVACTLAEQLQYRPALAPDGSAKAATVRELVRFEEPEAKK